MSRCSSASSSGCGVDELVALDREQPAITTAIGVALTAIGQQRDRMGGADEAIRRRLDRPGIDVSAGGNALAQGLDDVAA